MSAAEARQSTAKPVSSNSSSLLLQRKCACGGSAGLSGECNDCQTQRLLGKPLQAKLRIGAADDEFEREADRVADQVMQMPDGPVNAEASSLRTPLVQRRVAGRAAAGMGAAPPIVHDALSSPGQPLDVATRAFFEPRFGHDFAAVRIHTNAKAAESARAVNAAAYTVGDQIVAAGPHLSRALLAHELTHVVQQGAGQAALIQRAGGAANASSDEVPAACGRMSGADTIRFARPLETQARTVQLRYRKEEPPGAATQIFPADLSNLFPSHPLVAIAVEHSCGDWIRFDITDMPPGWAGPSLQEDYISLWGRAPPPTPGYTFEELGQATAEQELVFVADQFLADFIVRQRQSATGNDEEAFDLRVIGAFLEGIGEGLGEDVGAQWTALMQTYAKHALSMPFLQHRLWLGAMDGIADHVADTLVSLTLFVQDPQRALDQVMQAIGVGLMQPRSTSRQFGRAIGADLQKQVAALITPQNQEDPGAFLYELGKMVGPVVLEIILSIVVPEQILWRGAMKAGGKLFGFVDEFFDLRKSADIGWKPVIARNLHDPEALAEITEILRTGWIRLQGGHRVRINANKLERCSDCSIFARAYQPVLMRSDIEAAQLLRKEISELQTDADYLLQEGLSKEDVLAELDGRIQAVNIKIETVAKERGIDLDPADPRVVEFAEARFTDAPDQNELIESFMALDVTAKQRVVALPGDQQRLFAELWTNKRPGWRDAATRIVDDRNLTSNDQVAKALGAVKGTELSKGGALEQIIRRASVPMLKAGSPWPNPGFTTVVVRNVERKRQGVIDPRALRFGQDNASATFSNGKFLQQMADLLSDPSKTWEDVNRAVFEDISMAVTITTLGDQLFTLDHRRVICAQAAFAPRGGLAIPFQWVAFHELTSNDQGKFDALKRILMGESRSWPPRTLEDMAVLRQALQESPDLGTSIQLAR